MKIIILGFSFLLSVSSFANVSQFKCKLDGKASLNGKEVFFNDDSIIGNVKDEDIIFNEDDDNYQHTRTVKLQNNQVLAYAIEGYDVRNGKGTVTVIVTRNTSPETKTTSMFSIPLNQKKFVGRSGVTLDAAKESVELTLSCEMK